jgi:hypothetical protein
MNDQLDIADRLRGLELVISSAVVQVVLRTHPEILSDVRTVFRERLNVLENATPIPGTEGATKKALQYALVLIELPDGR